MSRVRGRCFAPGGALEQGAGRGALGLLRRTAPLPIGVFGWGQHQTFVWPELVVILPPGFDQMARFGEPEEEMFIEALIAQTAVERFAEGILDWFAGRDVVPVQSPGGPAQHCVAGKFGTVIADDGVEPGALAHHQLQLPHHTLAAKGSIHHRSQTLAAEVVQHYLNVERYGWPSGFDQITQWVCSSAVC